MKIDITYEKADMLRLVAEDLKKRGIQPKAGAPIEYKGAMQVKLTIDVEEGEAPEAQAAPVPRVRKKEDRKPVATEEFSSESEQLEEVTPASIAGGDLNDIMAASQRLVETRPGMYAVRPGGPARQLGPDESLEYPGEE